MDIKQFDYEKKHGSVFLYAAMRKINKHRLNNNKPMIIINNCPSHHTDSVAISGACVGNRKNNFKEQLPCTKKTKQVSEFNGLTGKTRIIHTNEFITIKNSDSVRLRRKVNIDMNNYYINMYKIK